MMTVREVSAHYNNQGVELLEQGRYADAIDVFKNALHTLMKAQGAPPNQLSEPRYDPFITQRIPSRTSLNRILLTRRDGNSHVYCRAFRIMRSSAVAGHQGVSTASSDVQDTMVIIFNLSLVYHFFHLATPEDRDPKHMLKALNCYEMVQALIMAEENQCLNNDPSILLVLMASCNNMGQIHHSTGNFDAAIQSMQLLSSTLTLWHTARNHLSLDADDEHGFSMNLMLLIEPGLAPAA